MANNAKITVAQTVKVLENVSEVASRSMSGIIDMDEYTQIFDTVIPSTTDKSITFGGLVSFDFVFIESDQDITVKLNTNTDTAIPLKAKVVSGTTYSASLLLTSSALTGLFVTNGSTSTSAQVRITFGKYSV